MNVLVEARVAGSVDLLRLREAIDGAVARHPAAGYRVAPSPTFGRVLRWERPERFDVDPVVVATGVEATLSHPIDLAASPAFRVIVVPTPGGETRLALCAHHAVFDGEGTVNFLREVVAAYIGTEPTWPPANSSRRAADHSGNRVTPGRLATIRQVLWPPRATRLAPASHLAPVVQHSARGGFGVTFARAGSTTVPVAGVGPSVSTVNDLLLAALHLAVAERNESLGRTVELVSVTVPVSGRSSPEQRCSISNHTGQTTVWSAAGDRADPDVLLANIRAQMADAKRGGAADITTESMGVTRWLPVRVRRHLPLLVSALTADRGLATSRLSNLGRIPSDGLTDPALDVRSLWFAPPCRPPQTLVIGACGYLGGLNLTARWCRPAWDERSAEEFLHGVRRQVARLGDGLFDEVDDDDV